MSAGASTSDRNVTEADACLDVALDSMAAGEPEAAIPQLNRALELDPGHEAATHALIRSLEDAGRLDEAPTLVNQRIAAAPDDVLAHTAAVYPAATYGECSCG
jgi:Tfp pilus assembly protein PilF